MVAPDIRSAYGGGFGLIARLFVIVGFVFGLVVQSNSILGSDTGTLVGALAVVAMPAIIILFAMNGDILESINAFRIIRLISAVGLPYGLLLAVLLVMSASIEVIDYLLGDAVSLIVLMIQTSVTNYYVILIFHLMGYMIFQYQGELGYAAREDYGERRAVRSEAARLLVAIQIRVKEGDYRAAVKQFGHALQLAPNDDSLNQNYFEFLLAYTNTKNSVRVRHLEQFSTKFMLYLQRKHRREEMIASYRRIRKLLPNFQPESPQLREAVAVRKNVDSS